MSTANSDAADDKLLSGLADDADDLTEPIKRASATPSGTPTAAAAAAAGGTDSGGEGQQGMTKYEHETLALKAAGRPLNARQRRTLTRLLARGMPVDAAAAKVLEANGGSEGDGQQQQQQQPQPPKVSSGYQAMSMAFSTMSTTPDCTSKAYGATAAAAACHCCMLACHSARWHSFAKV
jgi:hypothetical protein